MKVYSVENYSGNKTTKREFTSRDEAMLAASETPESSVATLDNGWVLKTEIFTPKHPVPLMKTRSKNPKPKKGVMPPALKKYWAARRKRDKKSLIPMNKFAPKRASATPLARKRRKNPMRDTFRLAIKKAGQTLYYDGAKFVKAGRFKRYATPSGAKAAAQLLAKKYSVLKGWTFYAVP